MEFSYVWSALFRYLYWLVFHDVDGNLNIKKLSQILFFFLQQETMYDKLFLYFLMNTSQHVWQNKRLTFMSLCSLHKDDSFLITTETLSFLNSNYYKWIQRLAGYMVGLK